MIICGIDSGLKNFAISIINYEETLKENLSNLPEIIYINKFNLLEDFDNKNQSIYIAKKIIDILDNINKDYKIKLLVLEQQLKIASNNYEIMTICMTWALINNIDLKIKSPRNKYKIIGLESTFKSYRNLKEKSEEFIKDKYNDSNYFINNIEKFNKQDDITDSIFIILQYILDDTKIIDKNEDVEIVMDK